MDRLVRTATTADVAAALGVSESTVRRWSREGRLPFERTPGGTRRYHLDEVERALRPGPAVRIPSVDLARAADGPVGGAGRRTATGNVEVPLVGVTDVEVLGRYVVRLTFDDGAVKVLDLEDWLCGPAFATVRRDYDAFRAMRVDREGTVEFPNGVCFSPGALYAAAKPAEPT